MAARALSLTMLLCASALGDVCQIPGTCAAPAAVHSSVAPASPRQQWGNGGGYCGAASVQTIALSKGAYLSQDVVRKAAPYGGAGHGDAKDGYEILHTNIGTALTGLKLNFEQWDFKSHAKPQSSAYKQWLKKHLAAGTPVVWFVMCQGDSHHTYNMPDGWYDHIEPVWGVFSNHSLNDTTAYPSDVVVHASNWDHNSYYRRLDSLEDSLKMDGNCANAVAGWPHDEAYPCIYSVENQGVAISGISDPAGKALPLSIAVDRWDEPDLPSGEKPAQLTVTVTIPNLVVGASYTLYKYDSPASLPTDSNYGKGAKAKHSFTASLKTKVFADPASISSAGTSYYLCVPVGSGAFEM